MRNNLKNFPEGTLLRLNARCGGFLCAYGDDGSFIVLHATIEAVREELKRRGTPTGKEPVIDKEQLAEIEDAIKAPSAEFALLLFGLEK